jgi:hypothetical protein
MRSVLPTPHKGIDFAAKTGTPVNATASGTVIAAGPIAENNGRYGNTVIIDHGGRQSLYAHLSSVNVKPGQQVQAGQRIGAAGATGFATGPHLHLEVRERPSDRPRIHAHQSGCLRHAARTPHPPPAKRITMSSYRITSSLLLAVSACAYASETPEPQQVQITGARADQRQRETTTSIVINHADIVRQGDQALSDVLKRLPASASRATPSRCVGWATATRKSCSTASLSPTVSRWTPSHLKPSSASKSCAAPRRR